MKLYKMLPRPVRYSMIYLIELCEKVARVIARRKVWTLFLPYFLAVLAFRHDQILIATVFMIVWLPIWWLSDGFRNVGVGSSPGISVNMYFWR